MSQGVAGAKASPREVADAIVTGLASGAAEVYPDPMALQLAQRLATDRATVQADFARYL
jgi:hypothetical protein